MSASECQQLLKVAAGHRLSALLVVVLNTAVRQGELLGLRWRDVDWAGSRLAIQQTSNTRTGGARFGDPKSRRSERPVSLTPMALAALRAHRERQSEERERAGERRKESELVFTTSVGTPILASNLQSQVYKPLLRKAGLPEIRFHDLRHSAASLLLAQGVPLKVVSELLGHAGIQITADLYGPFIPCAVARRAGDIRPSMHHGKSVHYGRAE